MWPWVLAHWFIGNACLHYENLGVLNNAWAMIDKIILFNMINRRK
jgi:hypothetical protein